MRSIRTGTTASFEIIRDFGGVFAVLLPRIVQNDAATHRSNGTLTTRDVRVMFRLA